MAHVQIWGNDELTEKFRFKNVLRELIGETLQLSIAPNLDMSHCMSGIFPILWAVKRAEVEIHFLSIAVSHLFLLCWPFLTASFFTHILVTFFNNPLI